MLGRGVEGLEMWNGLCFFFLSQKKSRGWLKWKKGEKKKNQQSEILQNQIEVKKSNKLVGFLKIFRYKVLVSWGKSFYLFFFKRAEKLCN